MSFTTLPSADLAVGKPVKKSLMDTIKDNFDNHESRISALSSGANKITVWDYSVNFADIGIGEIRAMDMTLTEAQQQLGSEWVLCDGGTAGGSFYNALTGHANVPDLRGEFLRGNDDGRGVDSGRVLGSTQADATAVNGLTMDNPGNHTHSIGSPSGGSGGLGTFTASATSQTGAAGAHTHALSGDSETRPRNLSLNFFIKINHDFKQVLKAKEGQTIVNVKGYVIDHNGLPTAGNFEFDILKSSTTRASLTTIFTTKPTLAYSATADGDATSSGTFNGGGATVASGDWLDLSVTSVMDGQTGLMIQVFSEPA